MTTLTSRFARNATPGLDALDLDANPIVYSIEGVPDFRTATLDWIERAETDGAVITSRLSRLECRVKPLRDGNADLLEAFEGFFAREGL